MSSAIRQKINNVDDYELGEILGCRQRFNPTKSQVKCQVEFLYNIVKIEGVF